NNHLCDHLAVLLSLSKAQDLAGKSQRARESKVNVASSFSCQHELGKFDPVSRPQCLLTLTERCCSLIGITLAHFHLCFIWREHMADLQHQWSAVDDQQSSRDEARPTAEASSLQ
ncbi:hypothetical protein ATANTOWER_024196, partial [Ataeniobius toweri]|nr:hypothetical protein [Ataeniobius toweri]